MSRREEEEEEQQDGEEDEESMAAEEQTEQDDDASSADDEPESAAAAQDDDASSDDDEPKPARRKKRKKKKRAKSKVSAKARGKSSKSVSSTPTTGQGTKPTNGGGGSRAMLWAVLGLAVGAAAGWFVRDARANQGVTPSADAAAAGSAGPCVAWQNKLCEGAGPTSATCQEARVASGLLTDGLCNAALAEVPATLDKVKAERVVCDELVSKLCKDLGSESKTCEMVKTKTPLMPTSKCKDMMDNYDKVIGQLKMMEQKGPGLGAPGMRPPGGPPGHGGPGAPPVRLPQKPPVKPPVGTVP